MVAVATILTGTSIMHTDTLSKRQTVLLCTSKPHHLPDDDISFLLCLSKDGLIVYTRIHDAAKGDVLLILFSLLDGHVLFLKVPIARKALHGLLSQVACVQTTVCETGYACHSASGDADADAYADKVVLAMSGTMCVFVSPQWSRLLLKLFTGCKTLHSLPSQVSCVQGICS